jgi:F-type H+-transporting ATPase subunit b
MDWELRRKGITLRAEPSFWLTPGIIVALLAFPASARAADLNLIPDFVIVGTNVLLFLLLIYPVNKLLVSPFLRVLDERAERTSGALAESERLRDDARARRSELEARLSEARAQAVARRNEILAEGEVLERAELETARQDSERAIEGVRRSVQAELSEARTTLQDDARALAREVATRILGRAV